MTPCFDDWKRLCLVLREIARGGNGRPLSGFEAQKRAQAVLAECGYTWPSVTAYGSDKASETNASLEEDIMKGDPYPAARRRSRG